MIIRSWRWWRIITLLLLIISPCQSERGDLYNSAIDQAVSRTIENPIFIGVTNSSFLPSILKGTTFTNDIYGLVNRTGTIVAGVALLSLSGYYFMRETDTLPRMDSVVSSALRIPSIFDRFFRKFYVRHLLQSFIFDNSICFRDLL